MSGGLRAPHKETLQGPLRHGRQLVSIGTLTVALRAVVAWLLSTIRANEGPAAAPKVAEQILQPTYVVMKPSTS